MKPTGDVEEESARARIRILIFEDNEDDAALLIDTLRRARLDPVWQRVDTRENFANVLSDRYDLILADYNVAQFTGLDALRLVRERGLDIPFILVSGSIGEDIAVAAMHSGADDYLLKDRTARLGPAVLRALEKRRLRRQKEETESALRESERRFSAMLASVQLLSVMLDREARITYCNDFLLRLTGWTRDEVLGSDWFERFVPGESAESRNEFLARVVQSPDAWHRESTIVTRTGERRTIRWNNSVLRSDAGEIIGTASIGQDVTEQLQAEAKILGLNRIHAMLSSINTLIVRAVSPQELFEGACRIAVEHGKFGAAWIGELDGQRLEVLPVAGAGVERDTALMRMPLSLRPEAPPDSGVVQRAVRLQKATFDNDITRNAASGGERRKDAIRRGFRSVSALPLLVDGTVIATFSVFASEPDFFDQEEMDLLNELAANLSLALEHMARKRRIERLSRVRALSGEINAAIVRIRDRSTLLEETCRIAAQHGQFEMVWIGEIDFDRESVRAAASHGFSGETVNAVSWNSIQAAQGTLSEAIRTRCAAVRNNIDTALPSGGLRDEAMRAGCFSTVCLPVTVDGRVQALIVLFASGRNFFDADELALLNEVAADISFALQSIASRERVEYLSYYDPLTGLPNRTLFIDRAGQMRSRGDEKPFVAFLLLNIERFRNINDTFGRRGGDELLRLIGKRLEAAFGGNECLARIGADNFGILIRGVQEPAMVVHAVENRVLGCFVQPFIIGGSELRVAVKVGIALHPVDGEQAETLLNNAEAALKKAQNSGERYLFYAAHMNAEAAQVVSLETRLRKAVDEDRFVLHYQPKIELSSGRVRGVEALIRWNDPQSGELIAPARFIPLLEETGMIFDVGKWAIGQALAEHRAWKAHGCAPERVAVNVSAVQLRRRDFVEAVAGVIDRGRGDANALELEVTESLLMHDVQANMRMLLVLRGMGVRISIDDFGTGYSSLSYITRLPISSIKIDRSFVNEMGSSSEAKAIVSTIITLAHALGLRTIAEGVETEEQAQILRSLDCDEGQGYLFGRPMPAEQLVDYLQQSAARPTS